MKTTSAQKSPAKKTPKPLTPETLWSLTACEEMRCAVLDLRPGETLDYFHGVTGHVFCGRQNLSAPAAARKLFSLLGELRESGSAVFTQRALTSGPGLNRYAYRIGFPPQKEKKP